MTLAQMDHDTKAYARSKRRSTLRHSRGRGRRVPKLAEEDAAQDEGPTVRANHRAPRSAVRDAAEIVW